MDNKKIEIGKYNCSRCLKNFCYHKKVDEAHPTCPTKAEGERLNKILDEYNDMENLKLARVSAEVVVDRYGGKSRIEETINFIKEMGYKKVGLAFCYALREEARLFTNLADVNGITVESVICKIGSVNRDKLGLKDFKAAIPMCNPIAQAKFLNGQQTELNILLGLCIGHDTLFIKYSDAPITVLAVKDRLYKHNPIQGFSDEEGYCIKTLKEKRSGALKIKNN